MEHKIYVYLRTLILACATLLAGCLNLTEVLDAEPEPALLGDLSGLYELSIGLADGDELGPWMQEDLPYGSRLQILHLKETSAATETLLAIEEIAYYDASVGGTAEVGGDEAQWERLYFEAEYDGTTIEGKTNGDADLNGRRVAGGGLLRLDDMHAICPAGQRYPLVAKLLCPVNPALSGIYGGTAKSCDTQTDLGDRYLALGFINEGILGLHYPGTDMLVEGNYSRQDESGWGWSFDLASAGDESRGGALEFTLSEAAGKLDLDGNFYAMDDAECSVAGCPDPECETLTLSRLSGGDALDCYAADSPPAMGSAWAQRVHDGATGQRFLVVETFYDQMSGEGAYSSTGYTEGILRRADEPTNILQSEYTEPCDPGCDCDPDCGCPCDVEWECDSDCPCDYACECLCDTDFGCQAGCECDLDCGCPCDEPASEYALRFVLPDVPDGTTVEYELFVWVYDPTSGVPLATRPECVVDDGDIDSW